MDALEAVSVNWKAVRRLESGHPWIFSSDVADRGQATPGSAVRVVDPKGKALGTALYSSTSQIALRMVSSRAEVVDQAFLHARIEAALRHRQHVVRDSDCYRWVYSEADQLPGLIVDRYGEFLVVQALNQAMDRLLPFVVESLQKLVQPRAIVARNDAQIRIKESLPLETKVLHGSIEGPVKVLMNGMQFQADLMGGQKTGIFLDQRENYAAAARWAKGRALDCFTCTGGFALHMARSCEGVEAVDSSETSLQTAAANAETNGIKNIEWLEANVFDLLSGHDAARRKFQTIVLDPPAFAKSRSALDGAIRGYKEINLRALKLLEPGGVLITNSCSHHLGEAELLQVVAEAALDARCTLRVLERRTQALDHPILLTVPETHYLKCLIFEVV